MIILLLTILFSLLFAYFATQNTTGVTIYIAHYAIPSIPIYLVILGSILTGVIIATMIAAVDSIGNYLELHRKENIIKELKKTTAELIKRVHQLELANEKEGKESEEL